MPDLTVSETIGAQLAARAFSSPEAVALAAPGLQSLTFAALANQCTSSAQALADRGIGVGDAVAIVAPNGPLAAAAFLAVAAAATAAPLNPSYRTEDFAFYLKDLGAKAVLVDAGAESPVRDAAMAMGVAVLEMVSDGDTAGRFRIEGDGGCSVIEPVASTAADTALVLHTSGTTSRPKQVPLTHANVMTSANNIARTLALTPGDRCLNVMPLFHIHGLMAALLASMTAGASVVCTPGFDADDFYAWLVDFSPTWFTAVPTMHQAILGAADRHAEAAEAAALRLVRSSSASLPPTVMNELEALFRAPVIEAYGMTEAAHQMASNPLPPGSRKPGTVGLAAGPEVAIIDSVGEPLPDGERGEIAIRGANVTGGYTANPQANASAYVNGWFRTGDEGVMDADGYVTITGRLKEMINRGGEKVTPREIDEVLLSHPEVMQAVAFAIPHPSLGEDVGAAVVLAAGSKVTEVELRRHCFANLTDFKVPSRVVCVDTIPKGPTGKLQRIGLADKLATAIAVEHEPAVGALESLVVTLWESILKLDGIGRHDNFFSLGGDSLSATAAMARLVDHTGVDLEPSELFLAPTPAELALRVTADTSVDASVMARLVPLREDSPGSPVFCVPGHGGDVFTFLQMARDLDSDRPIVAIEFSDELRADDAFANAKCRALADEIVELVRARQPSGPYDFVAFCFGVDVTHWVIRRLEDEGETVSTAVFIHAYVAGGERVLGRPLWKKAVLALLAPLPDGTYRRLGLPVRPPHPPRPPHLRAPVTAVRLIDEMYDGSVWDVHMGWDRYADVIASHDLAGDRRSVFQTPLSADLAAVVKEAVPRVS